MLEDDISEKASSLRSSPSEPSGGRAPGQMAKQTLLDS